MDGVVGEEVVVRMLVGEEVTVSIGVSVSLATVGEAISPRDGPHAEPMKLENNTKNARSFRCSFPAFNISTASTGCL